MTTDQDMRILSILEHDSNQSRKSIATKLDMSESSLSKQVSAFEDRRIIKRFTVELDYTKLGYTTHAVTFLQLEDQAKIPDLMKHLETIDEAVEIYTVLGKDDIYVRWLCRDNAHLMSVITTALAGPKVKHSETTTLAEERRRVRGPTLIKQPK